MGKDFRDSFECASMCKDIVTNFHIFDSRYPITYINWGVWKKAVNATVILNWTK